VQSENAYQPMLVTPDGIVTLVSPVQSEKRIVADARHRIATQGRRNGNCSACGGYCTS
jgi:hypothetical protein